MLLDQKRRSLNNTQIALEQLRILPGNNQLLVFCLSKYVHGLLRAVMRSYGCKVFLLNIYPGCTFANAVIQGMYHFSERTAIVGRTLVLVLTEGKKM